MPDVALTKNKEILLSGIGEDDLNSLDKIYDKYSSVLYGLIIRIVNTETLAENVLTKVFLNARQQASSAIADSSSVFCRLFKSCRQLSFDALKDHQLNNLSHTNSVYEATSTAFELLYYKGLNYNEAAIALNKTVEEIKADVRGAIYNLKTKEKI